MLKVDLFENIKTGDVPFLLKCFGIKTKKFLKDEFILKTASNIEFLGIMLAGKALIKNPGGYDEELKINDIFGHDIVCSGMKKSPVDIVAQSECEILFLPFEKLVTPCEKLCSYHIQVIKNIMKMISKRNSLLTDKLDIIGKKTTRDKILAFVKSYDKGEKIITVPFSRAQTAKFLCVDRSALSRELCKLRDEGVLKFHKNNFELL